MCRILAHVGQAFVQAASRCLPSAAGELKAFFHQVRKESPEQETLCLEGEYRGSQETGPVLCRAPLQQRSAVPRPHKGQSCASRCSPLVHVQRMHPFGRQLGGLNYYHGLRCKVLSMLRKWSETAWNACGGSELLKLLPAQGDPRAHQGSV